MCGVVWVGVVGTHVVCGVGVEWVGTHAMCVVGVVWVVDTHVMRGVDAHAMCGKGGASSMIGASARSCPYETPQRCIVCHECGCVM